MHFSLILRIGGLLTMVTMAVSSSACHGTALVPTAQWTAEVAPEW